METEVETNASVSTGSLFVGGSGTTLPLHGEASMTTSPDIGHTSMSPTDRKVLWNKGSTATASGSGFTCQKIEEDYRRSFQDPFWGEMALEPPTTEDGLFKLDYWHSGMDMKYSPLDDPKWMEPSWVAKFLERRQTPKVINLDAGASLAAPGPAAAAYNLVDKKTFDEFVRLLDNEFDIPTKCAEVPATVQDGALQATVKPAKALPGCGSIKPRTTHENVRNTNSVNSAASQTHLRCHQVRRFSDDRTIDPRQLQLYPDRLSYLGFKAQPAATNLPAVRSGSLVPQSQGITIPNRTQRAHSAHKIQKPYTCKRPQSRKSASNLRGTKARVTIPQMNTSMPLTSSPCQNGEEQQTVQVQQQTVQVQQQTVQVQQQPISLTSQPVHTPSPTGQLSSPLPRQGTGGKRPPPVAFHGTTTELLAHLPAQIRGQLQILFNEKEIPLESIPYPRDLYKVLRPEITERLRGTVRAIGFWVPE